MSRRQEWLLLAISLFVSLYGNVHTSGHCLNVSAIFDYRPKTRDYAESAPVVLYGKPVPQECDGDVSRCGTRQIVFTVHCIMKQTAGLEIPQTITIGDGTTTLGEACGNTFFAHEELSLNEYVVLVKPGPQPDTWDWYEGYRDQVAAFTLTDTVLSELSSACSLRGTWKQASDADGVTYCPVRQTVDLDDCSKDDISCPPYLYRIGKSCYGFGKEDSSRTEAKSLCKQDGGSLAWFSESTAEQVRSKLDGGADRKWWTAAEKVAVNTSASETSAKFMWNGGLVFESDKDLTGFDTSNKYLVLTGEGKWDTIGADDEARALCVYELSLVRSLDDNTNLNIVYETDGFNMTFCCKNFHLDGETLSITSNGGKYLSAQVLFDHEPKFFLQNFTVGANYTILLLDASGANPERGDKIEPYAVWMVVNVPIDTSSESYGELRPDYGSTLLPSGNKKTPDNLISLDEDYHPYLYLIYEQSSYIERLDASLLSPADAPVGSFIRPAVIQDSLGLTLVANRWFHILMDAYSIRHQVTKRGGHSTEWCPKVWPELADQVENGQIVCAKLSPSAAPPSVSHWKLGTYLVLVCTISVFFRNG